MVTGLPEAHLRGPFFIWLFYLALSAAGKIALYVSALS